ncbi:hypothetical protein EI94DRAFT_1825625 [Lactarius quietus]|nr:hypothetical protein EI94DRAFT_1825625 [Lactarius quietus]
MSYPQTATTDPYDFTLWPDPSEEELAAWAQAAVYAQQGPTSDNFSFDGLNATASWGQSATLPAATYGLQNLLDTDWTPGGMDPLGDILGQGGSFGDTTATDTMSFAPPPTQPLLTDDLDALSQLFSFSQSDSSHSHSSTPSLTDMSSMPSPQNDGTGGRLIPFPTVEGATPNIIQQPVPSSLQHTISGASLPYQFPPWFMGDVDLTGIAPTNYYPTLDFAGMNSNVSYPTQSDYTRAYDHTTAPTNALTTMVTSEVVPSSSSLGKRSRKSDENGSGPEKRARTSTGSVGAPENAQPYRIEEREAETWRNTGSSAPQQVVLPSAENAADGEDLLEIPGNLSARQRLMLQTTQAEAARGAVKVIKCKLCPKARFGTWETYKRHCKTCEKHPSELRFCPRCGDYFARPDSGIRHHSNKKYQEACLNTSQQDARKKKQKVEQLLREFDARLEQCLRYGQDIGARFSDIVNKMLTNTSKKVSKQEKALSEGDSWSAGLR